MYRGVIPFVLLQLGLLLLMWYVPSIVSWLPNKLG
jgi:TRAP-type mannitol/chloroaromatic compound transport system permease large subunit